MFINIKFFISLFLYNSLFLQRNIRNCQSALSIDILVASRSNFLFSFFEAYLIVIENLREGKIELEAKKEVGVGFTGKRRGKLVPGSRK